ncbi:DUF6422 family protein [Embleya scabrispora]|uniref:DUF6422 family protein n=1 Tax=Embleya scabrispora TaxID=159449 RepID=UPI0003A4E651|nr:DUF6422 family protein [Embleya scabrispora]MYS78927.1 hypothetical protein [Streptomyces sp. SID5474]
MSSGKRKLTEEQQKVVEDAAASVAKAYDDARARVLDAGVDPDEGGGTPCRRCGCDSFIFGADGLNKCKRTSPARCGHDWMSHDVF